MVKLLDGGLEINKFEIQSRYYVHFRTNSLGKYVNPFIFPGIQFTDPSARAGYDTRSIFEAEFNRFEFRVFLLLD